MTKLTHTEIVAGLMQLGFNSGWALSDNDYDNLLLWEHDEPKPSIENIRTAAAMAATAAAAKETATTEARAAALIHARSLGFTDEMIAVMYPGLVEADISPTEPEPTFADLTKRDEPPIVDP